MEKSTRCRKSSSKAATIWNIRLFATIIGLFFGHFSLEAQQGSYQLGLLPSINLNKGIGQDWSLNMRWEARLLLKKGQFANEVPIDFNYALSDFSLIASKRVGLGNSLAGGYLVRFQRNEVIHRAIQQFSAVKKYPAFRVAHRLATDQTFAPKKAAVYRFRYRITPEIPLEGQGIDAKEFYFKLNNEYLNAFQGGKHDLEIRIVPSLGYAFSDGNKLELGLDYRVNSFLASAPNHSLWVSLGWFVKR